VHGRDKQYRPIIILNAHLIDLKKYSRDTIIQALSFLMGIVRKYMMIGGRVENWIFMLETNKVGVFGLPLKGLGIIIDCMSVNFCGCLDKMYILNPSSGLDFTWSAIESFIDADTR
jgi:nicotinamide riboside transporter PnuC